jgi:NADPH:quinone reductase-like Zn-dependent oxidoreductase
MTHPIRGQLWYKAMHDAGYNFGPAFQKQLEVESVLGQRSSRSIVSLEEPWSQYGQSSYPMHPACIDGCLQTCAPSLWQGVRSGVGAVLIPAIIDDLVITSKRAAKGLSLTTAKYVGVGREDETKNYMSDASVYDPDTRLLLFQLSGLRYHKIDTRESPYAAHNYSRLVWKPDIGLLSVNGLSDYLQRVAQETSEITADASVLAVSEIIDLVAHKKPHLSVLEINMVPGDIDSLWLDGSVTGNSIRKACHHFRYTSGDASVLDTAREKYKGSETTEFTLLDISKTTDIEPDFDLAIVRLPPSATDFEDVVRHVRRLLNSEGKALFVRPPSSTDLNVAVNGSAKSFDEGKYVNDLSGSGFYCTHHLSFPPNHPFASVYLSTVQSDNVKPTKPSRQIGLFQFGNPCPITSKIVIELEKLGWQISRNVEEGDQPNTILVLDELVSSLFPDLTETNWETLKNLMDLGSRILWVTTGSQLNVTDPNKAMIHGLARTVRSEDPSVSLTTLDVAQNTGANCIAAIDSILQTLEGPAPRTHVENEFVERHGVIYVGRIQPDDLIIQAEKGNVNGGDVVTKSFHDSAATVRLRCERPGTIDSLCYTEVSHEELENDCVEVEIVSAGLNFKDIAITMGIIPENEHLLGFEGAGVIRRVGREVDSYKIGQRVVVFEKGTFANRIQTTAKRVHAIPDHMTFEEASTLTGVYLAALYGLYDLANTQRGHRVLIHSATGGIGLASIQICQHIGAEIFATAGTEEKRKFLTERFNIPMDHIFSSRTTAFASELMRLTNGQGVDVILSALTGDLLDESWRCIADGGTMVDWSKRDTLDRNTLSMEPFGRNASYRCHDMSHRQVPDTLIARLLDQLFGLLEAGHVKPISPITTFPWEDIQSAFRYMRSAKHVGKIVISNGDSSGIIQVPIRPAPRNVVLRQDVSYLIIGGLKGLCGSVATHLAQLGARHLVILSRSGYADETSQGILYNLYAQGCVVDLVQGDVSVEDDVRRAVKQASAPVGGVIQGAMVLRVSLTETSSLQVNINSVTGQNISVDDNRRISSDSPLQSAGKLESPQGSTTGASTS